MLLILYRLSHWLWRHKVPLIPQLIYYFNREMFRCSIPATCSLGGGTKLAYGGLAVIVHARSRIGKNCIIGSCVTIGGKSGWYEVPVIGDNVDIATGAKILGPIRVGNNVIIGANAVVTKDVPDNCIVAGIPAKIIKRNIAPADYSATKYRGEQKWPVTPDVNNDNI